MSKHLRKNEDHAVQRGPREGQVNALNAVSHSVEITYSGPLPPPEVLRSFEEIVPGSAQRIFLQFEEQSAHRRAMEAKVISSGAFSQRWGTVTASVLGLIGIGGGLWLAHDGKDIQGLTIFLGTLSSFVGTYLYQRKRQDKERDEKRAQLPSRKES